MKIYNMAIVESKGQFYIAARGMTELLLLDIEPAKVLGKFELDSMQGKWVEVKDDSLAKDVGERQERRYSDSTEG